MFFIFLYIVSENTHLVEKAGAVLTVACLIEIARIILTIAWGALSTGF